MIKNTIRELKHYALRRIAGCVFAKPLIVHWSAHKAMTGYYTGVMLELRKRTGLYFSAHYSNASHVLAAIRISSKYPSSVLLLSDLFDFHLSNEVEFRGTVTLRDPRDLTVSGYFYHQKTTEPWAHATNFDWVAISKDPIFIASIGVLNQRWIGRSYSNVLSELSSDDGLFLEMARTAPVIRKMRSIDLANPKILAIKYEEIIGNEVEAFDTIFRHYGLQGRYRNYVLRVVENLSAAKLTKHNGHIRSATSGQWRTVFKQTHLELFNRELRDCLRVGGYSEN
jgi:hypothetical protein